MDIKTIIKNLVNPPKEPKRIKVDSKNNISIRKYKSYEDYKNHQISKLNLRDASFLKKSDDEAYAGAKNLTKTSKLIKPGNSVLCLAARLGGEVRAFIEYGCFAIGIDLDPGIKNKFVLPGDFHEIQFSNNSVDFVYSNSIDHSLKLDLLSKECYRVLKIGGHLILDAGTLEGVDVIGKFEAIHWKDIDQLIKFFTNKGFKLVEKNKITIPFDGDRIFLKKNEKNLKLIKLEEK